MRPFVPLLYPALLEPIPRAAINGVLAYVGVEGILSTTLWSRALLLLSPSASFPASLLEVGVGRVHLFTVLQLLLLGGCWAINLSPIGLCVAFLIVALVPLRLSLLPKIFAEHELAALDEATDAAFLDNLQSKERGSLSSPKLSPWEGPSIDG